MPDTEDVGRRPPFVGPAVRLLPHILIADGDPDTRSLYREALAHLATIDEGANGADALAKALQQPPTLIITEIRLPDLDGYALCTTLRAEVTTRDTTILVVTASVCETTVGRAAHAGADDVLLKPCAIDRLRARVDDLLSRGRARGVRGEAVVPPARMAGTFRPSFVRAVLPQGT